MTIRVLVADDQDIVRTGLRMILDAQPGIEVVAEAVDGREALEFARRLRPDVCLFDIRMPELDGIELTRLLAGPDVADESAPQSQVVKIKRFAIEPMFEEDAIARMEELGHAFFIFVNAENERVAVLYRRRDGRYGLIEPTVGGGYSGDE